MNRVISFGLISWFSLLAFGTGPTWGQTAWYIDKSFGNVGTNIGQFSSSAIYTAQGDSNLIFCADSSKIKVFTTAGQYMRQWTTTASSAAISASSNEVFNLEGNNIVCYNYTGGVLRTISSGGGTTLTYDPSNDELYVAAPSSVKVYSRTGVFSRQWGTGGSGPGQFLNGILGIAILGSTVAVADDYNSGRIQLFARDGTFLAQFLNLGTFTSFVSTSDGYIIYSANSGNNVMLFDPRSGISTRICGETLHFQPGHISSKGNIIVADNGFWSSTFGVLNVLKRGYRSMGGNSYNNPPLPVITNVAQRGNSSIIDIDYSVSDPDSSNISVGVCGLLNTSNSNPCLDARQQHKYNPRQAQ